MHRLNIFRSIAPIANGVQIAEVKFLLLAGEDVRDSASDLTGNKGLAPTRTLMVKKDPIAGKELVRLTIIYCHPVGVSFRSAVWTARMKRSRFALRCRRAPEHFGRAGLIKPSPDSTAADGLQQTGCTQGRSVPCVLGHLETDLDMALRAKIVDLVGLHVVYEVAQLLPAGQIAIVEKKARLGIVRVIVNVIQPLRIKRAGPTDHPMHLISQREQIFGEIRTVLACDASNQRALCHYEPLYY